MANRPNVVNTVTITNAVANCTEVHVEGYNAGSITINGASGGLDLYSLTTSGGTAVPLNNTAGTQVSFGVSNTNTYELPPQVFTVPYMKFVDNANTTCTGTIYLTKH
jgi:hypothetical protein